ncbi:MAG: UbiA family prenyltransferase [Desulfobacterales bacterium]|nr:MAG: UbiA family prenyltransferase [Desulfobacterales bacterium]
MTSATKISIDHEADNARKKQIWRTFADISRLHITAIAALGVFTFGWLFTGVYPWLLTAVCALDWFVVNLINRTVDLEEDKANIIIETGFVDQNRQLLLKLSLMILLTSLVVVHLLNPAITGLRIACHLLGAFYNWPILPGRRRLKQLYFWKNTASAIGFLITVFGYPLATARWGNQSHSFPPGITWETVVFTAVFFFLFEISYEIIYDLRDLKGDALLGIRTYPVVHGKRKAIYIVDSLIFASMTVLAIGYLIAFVPWRIFIMIAAPFLQLVVYKHALHRGISARDCIRITWMGVAMLCIYHMWVLADLPGVGL